MSHSSPEHPPTSIPFRTRSYHAPHRTTAKNNCRCMTPPHTAPRKQPSPPSRAAARARAEHRAHLLPSRRRLDAAPHVPAARDPAPPLRLAPRALRPRAVAASARPRENAAAPRPPASRAAPPRLPAPSRAPARSPEPHARVASTSPPPVARAHPVRAAPGWRRRGGRSGGNPRPGFAQINAVW